MSVVRASDEKANIDENANTQNEAGVKGTNPEINKSKSVETAKKCQMVSTDNVLMDILSTQDPVLYDSIDHCKLPATTFIASSGISDYTDPTYEEDNNTMDRGDEDSVASSSDGSEEAVNFIDTMDFIDHEDVDCFDLDDN